MKNKKLAIAAALVGLTLGGFSVASVASAQGYGGAPQDGATETVQVDPSAPGGIVLVQEVEADENAPEGERSEHQGRRGHRGGCNLEAVAEAIGIDEADLKEALGSGDTIADVAAANGVSIDAVIDAMVADMQERIDEKVAEGRLTQAEADEKLDDAADRITDRVNGVETDRGPDA